LFWALADDGTVLAHAEFTIWKGRGKAFANACAEGIATKYRVVCEAMSVDWTDEWDDRVAIDLKICDSISFTFTLHSYMTRA
jgi:hypothetical protein